ncbi:MULTISPECIES: hypothetical protein [unclassified Xanthobacter]|uniref:hypothetical protein n=1 Tax=unclassified Xanthobacter TaxID=2623496 RepID=UPI001F3C3943|nr:MULTISPECIES: hypothetical protein [unclassified Xanthobacter]
MTTKVLCPDEIEHARWMRDVLDHWADEEDARACSCPDADIQVHREREGAYRDGAARLRKMLDAAASN